MMVARAARDRGGVQREAVGREGGGASHTTRRKLHVHQGTMHPAGGAFGEGMANNRTLTGDNTEPPRDAAEPMFQVFQICGGTQTSYQPHARKARLLQGAPTVAKHTRTMSWK